MNYELKDKLNMTNGLLTELTTKGWQEIEYLQAQIANIADNPANTKLRQLLKNLLTSYYVFTGGIETLESEFTGIIAPHENIKAAEPTQGTLPELDVDKPDEITTANDFSYTLNTESTENEINDPFEYFVDFDDPIGEPITDKDLYNN